MAAPAPGTSFASGLARSAVNGRPLLTAAVSVRRV